MTVRVAKFGGTTFADPADYRRIARYLLAEVRATGVRCVAVVSAMPGHTEGMRALIDAVNPVAGDRETAALLTLVDGHSAVLLATAVDAEGGRAAVLESHRNGFRTDRNWMRATLVDIDSGPITAALGDADVVCLASGQASEPGGTATWLGKNSGDLSAVAAAVAAGADRVDMLSDVDGVYTADPRHVPDARLIPEISVTTAHLMATHGAKVLHGLALTTAGERGIDIVCRHNRDGFRAGTRVTRHAGPAVAVVTDLRAQVLDCGRRDRADAAERVLRGAGLPTVRPRPELVAVTGGYSRPGAILAAHRIHPLPLPDRLVTLVRADRAEPYLAPDREAALRLARELHATHVTNHPARTARPCEPTGGGHRP